MTEGIRFIEVVAAVIADARGRVLLSRRKEDSDLAGLWEFPGGKIDPGENAEQALRRELREEIGIEAVVGEFVIKVPQLYPSKRLTLDVRHVRDFTGKPRGMEGQALMWVEPSKLGNYSMPNADIPVVAALTQPSMYAITPDMDAPFDQAAVSRWVTRTLALIKAGHQRIQLRAPSAPSDVFRQAVAGVIAQCGDHDGELLINRDLELARRLRLGLHLSASQLQELNGRPEGFDDVSVAASCHYAGDLAKAELLSCDFAVVSPVKRTRTHPELAPIGWEGFADLREHSSLPIYALGGLTALDFDDAREQGAQGISAIRAFSEVT